MSNGDSADAHLAAHYHSASALVDYYPARDIGGNLELFHLGNKGSWIGSISRRDCNLHASSIGRARNTAISLVYSICNALGRRKVGLLKEQRDPVALDEIHRDIALDYGTARDAACRSHIFVTLAAAPPATKPPTVTGPCATA